MINQIKNIKCLAIIFLAFILQTKIIYSQDNIVAIYKGNQIEIKKKGIKKGNSFKIRIEGINTILHKSVFKFKDFELISEVPTGFLLPNLAKKKVENGTTENYPSNVSDEDIFSKHLKTASFFIDKSSEIDEYRKSIKSLIDGDKFDTTLIKKRCKEKRNQWISMLEVNFSNLFKEYVISEIARRPQLDETFIQKTKEVLDASDPVKKIKMELDSINKLEIIEANKNQIKFYLKILKFIDKKNYQYFTAEQIQIVLSYYEVLREQNKNTTGNFRMLEQLSFLEKRYRDLKKVYPIIMSGLAAIESGASGNIKKYSNSLPHYPDKDLSNAEIYLINRFNPYDTIATAKTDLFVKHKFKIDFSTGPAINTLVQKAYFFTKTDSINSGIDKEKNPRWDLGVAALMHGDWRFTPSFAAGPFIGASLSVLDEKPRYIVGLSGSIGKVRSISVNVGANFGQIKTLSKQVSSDGDNYDGSSDLSRFESVPLASKIKWGFFFGVTYNLTRTRK